MPDAGDYIGPEARACVEIDKRLTASGWSADVQAHQPRRGSGWILRAEVRRKPGVAVHLPDVILSGLAPLSGLLERPLAPVGAAVVRVNDEARVSSTAGGVHAVAEHTAASTRRRPMAAGVDSSGRRRGRPRSDTG